MRPITNLNLVDQSKVIVDDKGKPYIIIEKRIYSDEHICYLVLSEVFDKFTTRSMHVPTACNENYEFISTKKSSWVYKFYETDILVEQAAKLINDLIRQSQIKTV